VGGIVLKQDGRMSGTSGAGVSGRAPLALRAVCEVAAVAQGARRAGVAQRVGFGRTGRTHEPISIHKNKTHSDQLIEREEYIYTVYIQRIVNTNYQS